MKEEGRWETLTLCTAGSLPDLFVTGVSFNASLNLQAACLRTTAVLIVKALEQSSQEKYPVTYIAWS